MSHYSDEREEWYQELGRVYAEVKTVPKKQVGGNHYQSAIQPVDYINANNLGFLEGNVIKYITRYKRKGGVEDLRKARHYLDMLIQQEG